MATQELALKLQRRLRLEQESEAGQGTEQNGLDENCGLRTEPARGRSPGPPTSGEEPPAKELTANADSELRAQLSRRQSIHEGTARPRPTKVFKPYTEFPEFSRRQIKDMESLFRRYDSGKDGYIDLMELKLMMEKLGAPQTHLGLKNMIKEVDEDLDNKLSFREVHALSVTSRFEAEIKAEQMARKQEEEERKHRRALFRERQAAFSQ
ncbi:EF-hand domain-containing protein D1 isoform X2 [Petaurus breviceps papuanus]|uniref:EF-hand domain-containing protein D1 isoform X2 n=1 Tax=Petaurus breviceps papuanus TaxID=3040969 RepID=UPI0036D7C3B3